MGIAAFRFQTMFAGVHCAGVGCRPVAAQCGAVAPTVGRIVASRIWVGPTSSLERTAFAAPSMHKKKTRRSDMKKLTKHALIPAVILVAAASAAHAADHTVAEKGKEFSVGELSAKVGDTIKFENQDSIVHNIFSLTPGHEFQTKARKPGEAYTLKLDKEGKIAVRCALHPKMKLDVTVSK